ncbi:syntaxin-6 isoform X1 [Octopus bimaculoides]|uniref:Syntaxin-6 isoform X1 n=1 Tax=Octopus sinensis TaxID=2607531 RepID=A0A6P7SRB7_9MOLL|nr:syntaxin-6 isoform X1 [Octopus bimaculoides]XP_029640847.1 syntaxin-6 isoform X1 [Octopus sinensis]|eukprot:XP_014784935.1 PREDICTED: syntaxin-6-like isoform X1 [Octopus bimaculoides]
MPLEDPFFVVRDEVQKAVHTAQGLYMRWCELQEDLGSITKEELDWTTNELRNSLRSIEWDLEDLEETIGIVEKNPKKFKITDEELRERRGFIEKTKQVVREIKDHMASPATKSKEQAKVRQALLTTNGPSTNRMDTRYSRLDTEMERSNQRFIDDNEQQQQMLINNQDDQLDMIGASVGVLKNMSHQIGNELDDQNVMLRDFHKDLESADSRLDSVMKKMAKVLHMSNDRRQWCAIVVLIVIMVIIIALFFIL